MSTATEKLKCHYTAEMLLRPVASPAMGHWGMCPLDFQRFNFLVHSGVNLRANYPNIV